MYRALYRRARQRSHGFGVSVLGADTFTRADSAAGLGTATVGGAWTAVNGVIGISSGAAYLATDGGTNQTAATLSLGVANVSISIVLSVVSDEVRIVARSSDASNCIVVQPQSGTGIRAYRQQAGSYTEVGAALATYPSNGATLTMVAAGANWAVLLNGVQLFTFSESFNLTATKHGLGFGTGGGAGRITSITITTV